MSICCRFSHTIFRFLHSIGFRWCWLCAMCVCVPHNSPQCCIYCIYTYTYTFWMLILFICILQLRFWLLVMMVIVMIATVIIMHQQCFRNVISGRRNHCCWWILWRNYIIGVSALVGDSGRNAETATNARIQIIEGKIYKPIYSFSMQIF